MKYTTANNKLNSPKIPKNYLAFDNTHIKPAQLTVRATSKHSYLAKQSISIN